VFTEREHSMGLMVDEIVDIVEDKLKVELCADQSGLIGSAVIAGKATDIVDISDFLRRASADWLSVDTGKPANQTRRLLLVDDSPFFRNMITPLLQAAGYTVTAVTNATQALSLREAGEDFDVIVSDIEMPGMNGLEFATKIREAGQWRSKPLVALSAHASPSDFEKGRAAGFTDYVGKFDRSGLMRSLAQVVQSVGGAA
jgi:two-component system chemotaxis sensor kinase CheA